MSLSCKNGQSQRLINQHPCYSKEAHHRYARMHLAVAPACNIQCHYCNRKYDCANESRPGVVTRLLTPDEALAQVAMVKTRMPQLTVVGIAGPGDALANPERILATCRRIKAEFPDLMLCLSTNGLELPKYVETLAGLGVHHVTVTVNAIDPAVGAHIYPWIFWKNRRIRGLHAAQILIDHQQEGIARLVARGILVKINSVLIPGVNADHLPLVHETIAGHGVFVHNIMPLISAPAHGTYYGLMGQKEPTLTELEAVRSQCGHVAMMTHCRQCRADAVGMLGEEPHVNKPQPSANDTPPLHEPFGATIVPLHWIARGDTTPDLESPHKTSRGIVVSSTLPPPRPSVALRR
ncbi:MAG: nitrogenase cofactor biosynthesis protein NifB [Magnetococcales bacterium]|nr:nitrogenase cofactor biosynthesis protein NifB [Magnetococcales bacterium]